MTRQPASSRCGPAQHPRRKCHRGRSDRSPAKQPNEVTDQVRRLKNARNRKFESISLQRRVHCELAPHGFGASVIGQQLALRGEAISPSGPTY
jgi:hypothetical protein